MTPRHFGETHIMLSWRILVYNIVYIYQVEFSVFIIYKVKQNLRVLVPTLLHMFLIYICCQQTQSLLFDVYCWALVQPQLYSVIWYENIINSLELCVGYCPFWQLHQKQNKEKNWIILPITVSYHSKTLLHRNQTQERL